MSEAENGNPPADEEEDPNLEEVPEGDADKKEGDNPEKPEGEGGEEKKEGDGGGEDKKKEPAPPRKPLVFKDPMELDFLVKMPHEVTMTTIPRMNDLRGIWRQGLQ